MSQTHASKSGVKADLSHDSKYNLGTQAPTGMLHSAAGLTTTGTVTDVAVGQEFTLIARCGIDENSPAASTEYQTDIFDGDCPFKMRVLEVRFEVVDLTVADFTDADAGNLDLTVLGGPDGSEVDILADFALDDDYANGTGASFPTAAVALTNTEVDVDESLHAILIVDPDATAGATNDGAMVDVILRCIRVL